MKKLPTAEELILKKLTVYNNQISIENAVKLMIEFTKLHVEACKEEIADDYTYYLEGDEGSERLNEKKFFKEAYPIENIK